MATAPAPTPMSLHGWPGLSARTAVAPANPPKRKRTSMTRVRRVATLSSILMAMGLTFACQDVTRSVAPRTRETKPSLLISPAGMVVVSPADMAGWVFFDDQHDTLCTTVADCSLVPGPNIPPLGSGSAQLAVSNSAEGFALVLPDYGGTRLDEVSTLSYATYRSSADPGNNLAIALQFNVDYDMTDTATAYQGRLVFEPYQGIGGNVPDTTWQTWNTKVGRWWGSRSIVWRSGIPCPTRVFSLLRALGLRCSARSPTWEFTPPTEQ